MSMELHAESPAGKAPDPQQHPVCFLAYTLMTDTGESSMDGRSDCICVDKDCIQNDRAARLERETKRFSAWFTRRQPVKNFSVTFVPSELDLINLFILRVRR